MDFGIIEEKWLKFWEEHADLFVAQNISSREKKYVLVEFPYPSGSGLHVGHAFSFTGGDVYARFKRMQGYNVLFPMGWDAFGLPTENYAIKMKRKPQEITKENTDNFRAQMKRLAFSFDWSREVNTTDPQYYKWTQWIFVQLFKRGLAHKQEMPINWCPSCKVGLANEEVVNGKCERCGSEVSRRNISQWVVKITDYADRLIGGLEKTAFIDKVKAAQVNWIGKSEGAKIRFQILDLRSQVKELEVFTTRPDTIYGVTFMVIAPEHKLVESLSGLSSLSSERKEEMRKYVEETRRKSDLERAELNKEKTGVFSGLYAINPVNDKEIPIWISDFVLSSYGTGAIMSVPAHDERDQEFAKKFGLEIIEVVDKGGKLINSDKLNGLTVGEAKKRLVEMGISTVANSYHLRDWIFSRQHYWGEPIPMIFCENCASKENPSLSPLHEGEKREVQKGFNAGWQPVPEDQLPVKLPEVEAYEPTDDGQSPLAKMTEWVKTTCPVCGGEAKRETDTMPNWAGSDWYYLRYTDSHNNSKLADFDLLKKWLPVDVYIGGDEHNTLHLLYSRFIHQFLFDLRVVPTEEPYYRRLSHGVILGPDGQRMSKSRGNVIVPDDIANKYGVDVVRMYLMFMGPFEATMVWNEKTLNGVKRFLDRFEDYIIRYHCDNSQPNHRTADRQEVDLLIGKLVGGVTSDLESFSFNTAIAKMMKAMNILRQVVYWNTVKREDISILIRLIAPLAPYLAEHLWGVMGFRRGDGDSVHIAGWPRYEEKYMIEQVVTIPVAVNGRVREQLRIKNEELGMTKEVVGKAKELEKIRKWIEGREIIREVYVPGKMVNLVVK